MLKLLALFLLPFLPAAGDSPKPPVDGTFFLEGVSVWQPDGTLVSGRNLLLHHGLVEAIGGPELAAPAEARRLQPEEGETWVVYPGLIHGQYPEGLPSVPPNPYPDKATDPKTGPIVDMEWGSRKDLRGWLYAADAVQWDPKKEKSWREAGFTSAVLVPTTGLLRGHSAWASLNGLPFGDALLQREGLLALSLKPNGRGYPSTPMAALAVLRQAFLDAHRLSHLEANGSVRVHENPDLNALRRDLDRPLLVLANREREIENVLDLMREAGGHRRVVILGGHEAVPLIDRLKQAGASVLFTLDLEDAPKSDEELKVAPVEERPYWQEPARLRDSDRKEHQRLVERFRKLREAGVACALVPAAGAKDLGKDLAQLLEDGLGADTLLRAMTRDVADILGLPAGGRVAPGGAADLVVSRGPWNLEKPDLAWVFADGRGFEMAAPDKKKDGSAEKTEGEKKPDDLAFLDGEWRFKLETPGGEQELAVLVDTGEGTVESFSLEDRSEKLKASDVRFDEDGFSFKMSPPEMDGIEIEARIEVDGDSAQATLGTPFGDFSASGQRVSGGEQKEAVAEAGEKGAAAEEKEARRMAGGLPTGHPEYPVETRADRIPADKLDGNVLLRGATLHTLTGQEPFVGDLLIQDGRIAGIGREIHTLRSVKTLDLHGWHLIPGIIDPHSHLALDSVNEGSVSISAECRIADMVHPGSLGIFRAAAGGTAVNQTLHGSANPIGGQAAVWELDVNRETIADLLLPGAPQGIKFALGENVKQSNFPNGGRRFPTSRSGVEAVYRRAFTRAREYAEERDRFLAGRNPSFRRDVRLEVLADILANRIHVQCHSYRADEILMFLGICKEFGIERPTFQHVLEGYKVAPEMAAYGAMGSTFSDWWAYKIEAYDAIPWNVALMHKAGVIASINSDSGEMIRRLNTEAGKSLLYGGVPYEDALAFCTLNPARQIHMEDRLGSLEVGKDGTVTVFDGPPLSTHSRCMLTLARGRTLFEHTEAHDRMWQQYARDVKAFAQAHQEEPAGKSGPASKAPRRNQADLQRWIHSGQGVSYLIRNARIHPISAPAFQGDVLVENGLLSWTGARWGGSLPQGCIEVDAGGQHLFPGFLDGGDQTGLYEIGSVRGTRDDSETGDFQPDLSIAAAIHAASSHIRVQRMTGITSVLVHGRRGRVTGQAALIHLDGEVTPDLIVVPDLALHLQFPNVAAPGEGKEPKDPDALEDLNRKFDQALAQGEILEHCRETGEEAPEIDLKLEALLPFARGDKPVLIQTGNFLTLMRAHRWAKERGLSAVFLGCPEAWKGAGILGSDRARLLVGPIHRLPRNPSDPFDAPFREAGILAAAGCQVGLCTENPEVTRNLPFQAATAAAHGWGNDQALEAITLGTARILGVDDMVGSIEPGKVADLFLCTGDPLDFESRVTRMWIGGREVELTSRQTELRDRYEARIDRKKKETVARDISTR